MESDRRALSSLPPLPLPTALGAEPLPGGEPAPGYDHWHDLLSSRYVCEACLIRYFSPYPRCKGCGATGTIRPLNSTLFELADTDAELREIISQGQVFGTGG